MPPTTDMFLRNAQSLVLEALADTRVVFIAGARQVGKSTLAQQIARTGHASGIQPAARRPKDRSLIRADRTP